MGVALAWIAVPAGAAWLARMAEWRAAPLMALAAALMVGLLGLWPTPLPPGAVPGMAVPAGRFADPALVPAYLGVTLALILIGRGWGRDGAAALLPGGLFWLFHAGLGLDRADLPPWAGRTLLTLALAAGAAALLAALWRIRRGRSPR